MNKVVQYDITESVLYVNLNNPPGNAIELDFFGQLNDVLELAENSNDLKGLIISGTGRHFSEGSDINQLLRIADQKNDHIFFDNLDILRRIKKLPIPSVAVIRGICLGSATELALHCDYRFVAENALIGLPETSFGLIPGLGGISLARQSLSIDQLLSFLLSENNLTGTDAIKFGLADHLANKKMIIFEAGKFIRSVKGSYNRLLRNVYLDRHFRGINV